MVAGERGTIPLFFGGDAVRFGLGFARFGLGARKFLLNFAKFARALACSLASPFLYAMFDIRLVNGRRVDVSLRDCAS